MLTSYNISLRCTRRSGIVALLLSCLLVWGNASATSVRETSVAELAERSAVIFEGVVAEVRARKSQRGVIVTEVVFDVLEVIKGRVPQSRVSLEFLGGAVAGERLVIPAMHYPEPGERGIYFAESIEQPLINPLYGWDQGRFLVQDDQVLTADRHPVVDVQSAESVFFAAPVGAVPLSTGVAKGVLARPAASGARGLSSAQFKQRIRNLLGTAP